MRKPRQWHRCRLRVLMLPRTLSARRLRQVPKSRKTRQHFPGPPSFRGVYVRFSRWFLWRLAAWRVVDEPCTDAIKVREGRKILQSDRQSSSRFAGVCALPHIGRAARCQNPPAVQCGGRGGRHRGVSDAVFGSWFGRIGSVWPTRKSQVTTKPRPPGPWVSEIVPW